MDMEKRFVAIWDGRYYVVRGNVHGRDLQFDVKVVGLKFFDDRKGYEEEDRKKIDALEVGECVALDASPFGHYQWVLRVHDVEMGPRDWSP